MRRKNSSALRHAVDNGRISGEVWSFATKRFRVTLELEQIHDYQYDGEDENGETQSAIDSGELVAFGSTVLVYLDGNVIGRDDLYGSVYERKDVKAFWQGHRSPDAMNRNCSVMRMVKGDNMIIGHYFPDMVKSAIQEARERVKAMRSIPRVRV